jgi:two-component system chemotaxis sensor kinase CheA
MNDNERGKIEFLTEAEDIFEALGRDLVLLDESLRSGNADPDLINDIFRAVHTLKGLAGLFGATTLNTLANELETKLDSLRLGKSTFTSEVVDTLFRALDVGHRLLLAENTGAVPPLQELESVLTELRGAGLEAKPEGAPALDLDPNILSVLTEYEEHRLRVNVEAGNRIFRLRTRFSLLTIDESLEQLKATAKPHGEIITYLPTGEGADADSIELDILMASKRDQASLEVLLADSGAVISEVPRKAGLRTPMPAAAFHAADTGEHEAVHAAAEQPLVPPSSVPPPQEMRVGIQKLDRRMNAVSELAIVKSSIDRLFERMRPLATDRTSALELLRLSRTFDRQLESMQQGILEVRMVPLGQLFERLSRVARQVGRNADKQFNLVITGAETEVDKLIVEELSDPLMHMMRNAIDHGIESAQARKAAGKPEVGTIALNAFQKGNHVLIELEDDGGGIDTERVLEVALSRGFINPADVRSTSRRDVLNLIFTPGLSTRKQAGDISGRGVGMDVVKTNIGKLGGVIDVQSEVGIGTKLAITLPITLAIVRVLVAEVEGHTFAIPLANVREAVQITEDDIFSVDGHEAMTLRGSTLRLARLTKVFDIPERRISAKHYVVVTMAGSARLGLVVHRLIGGQDVVMKTIGASLRSVRGFAGAADLGEERLGLVLDTPSLYEEVVASDRRRAQQARSS